MALSMHLIWVKVRDVIVAILLILLIVPILIILAVIIWLLTGPRVHPHKTVLILLLCALILIVRPLPLCMRGGHRILCG